MAHRTQCSASARSLLQLGSDEACRLTEVVTIALAEPVAHGASANRCPPTAQRCRRLARCWLTLIATHCPLLRELLAPGYWLTLGRGGTRVIARNLTIHRASRLHSHGRQVIKRQPAPKAVQPIIGIVKESPAATFASLVRQNSGRRGNPGQRSRTPAEPAAGRQPAVPRRAAPATAAIHAERAHSRPRRIVRRRLRIVTIIIPILTPLPYVPMHVVETPGVRLLLAHRMGLVAGVAPYHAYSSNFDASSPKQYRVLLPARQAYSHWPR